MVSKGAVISKRIGLITDSRRLVLWFLKVQ